MTHKKSGNRSFFAKEGFVSVSLSWIVLSVIGALPFVLSGVIHNPVDAMFEIVSVTELYAFLIPFTSPSIRFFPAFLNLSIIGASKTLTILFQ